MPPLWAPSLSSRCASPKKIRSARGDPDLDLVAEEPASGEPTGGRNGVPSNRAIARSRPSSISLVTGASSCRSQPRCQHLGPLQRRGTQVVQLDSALVAAGPQVGEGTTQLGMPLSGGRSSSTTDMPTWLTGLLVVIRIARSAAERASGRETARCRRSG
ncbi:MAG: hypothetical protein ACR2G2_03905 [Pseudonocardia sp.]